MSDVHVQGPLRRPIVRNHGSRQGGRSRTMRCCFDTSLRISVRRKVRNAHASFVASVAGIVWSLQ